MANCVHCAHWRVDVYIVIGTHRTDESDRYGLCVIISVTNCVFENGDLTYPNSSKTIFFDFTVCK